MPEASLPRTKLRRWDIPGATCFITAVAHQRTALFADPDNMDLLRMTLRAVQALYPFRMQGYAFMPDHLHLLISIPEQTSISRLMQSFQWNYTRSHKRSHGIEVTTHLWQRGFWDHVIREEDDFARHLDYIHYNPVKHGLVTEPQEYPHTSLREYIRRGWYGSDWVTTSAKAQIPMGHEP